MGTKERRKLYCKNGCGLTEEDIPTKETTEWEQGRNAGFVEACKKADIWIQNAKEEEHQFFLNTLDGIDKADKEMGNTGGETEATRFALKSRII